MEFEGLADSGAARDSGSALATSAAARTIEEKDDMKTILLTTDLSEESRRAFGPVLELAGELGHRVVLLFVAQELSAVPYSTPLAPPVIPPDIGREVERAREALTEFQQDLDGPVEIEVLTGRDIAETIATYAERIGASFIALATHGRSGFRRLVMGSVAEQVLRCSSTPVLCYPRF